MSDAPLDVVAVGNAIVDVLVSADEDLLARLGLVKGTMALVDAAESARLHGVAGTGTQVSGGSAANTAVGVAALGGAAAFVGRVADDELGRVFTADIRGEGVSFEVGERLNEPGTGRCLSMITGDGERTMCTFLGAAACLGPDDLDVELARRARILYLEGFLWDSDSARVAIEVAVAEARGAGARVALSLSDPFCVERNLKELTDLVASDADLVFGNEAEIRLLAGTDDPVAVMARLGRPGLVIVMTRAGEGSVVLSADEMTPVPAHPAAAVVDTTGAGDLYAAGFMVGLCRGLPAGDCARLGGLAAAEIIGHVGARPLASLTDVAREAGLLTS